MWDFIDRKEQQVLKGRDPAKFGFTRLAFSPDGKLLTCLFKEEALTWEVSTGQIIAAFPIKDRSILAFSPDGRTLALGSHTVNGEILLWDLVAKKEHASLSGHFNRIQSLAFSPDGRTLASGDEQGTIKLWEVVTGQERATIRRGELGKGSSIRALAFSPDGRTLTAAPQEVAEILVMKVGDYKNREMPAALKSTPSDKTPKGPSVPPHKPGPFPPGPGPIPPGPFPPGPMPPGPPMKIDPPPMPKPAFNLDKADTILKIDGELTDKEPKDRTSKQAYFKVFPIKLQRGKTYAIDMVSAKMDSFLVLLDGKNKKLAQDDDGGGLLNARIIYEAPADGEYRVVATTFPSNQVGSFTITVRRLQDEKAK